MRYRPRSAGSIASGGSRASNRKADRDNRDGTGISSRSFDQYRRPDLANVLAGATQGIQKPSLQSSCHREVPGIQATQQRTSWNSSSTRTCWNSSSDRPFCQECGIWFHNLHMWEDHQYMKHGRKVRRQQSGWTGVALGSRSGAVASLERSSTVSAIEVDNQPLATDDRLLTSLLCEGAQHGCTLEISIVSARGLKKSEWMLDAGLSNPFCTCEILGKPATKIQTLTAYNDANPVWNHRECLESFNTQDLLFFAVWGTDPRKQNDLIGSVTLTSKRILPSFEGEVRLADVGKGIEAFLKVRIIKMRAGVHPSHALVPRDIRARPAQGIRVMVLRARCLRNAGWEGRLDPYCICYVSRDLGIQTKTRIHKGALDPEWNHEDLLVGCNGEDSLEITVWNRDDTFRADEFLGGASLTSQQIAAGFDGELALLQNGIGSGAFVRIKARAEVYETSIPSESEIADADNQALASLMASPRNAVFIAEADHDQAVIHNILQGDAKAEANHDQAVIHNILQGDSKAEANHDQSVIHNILQGDSKAEASHDQTVIQGLLHSASSHNRDSSALANHDSAVIGNFVKGASSHDSAVLGKVFQAAGNDAVASDSHAIASMLGQSRVGASVPGDTADVAASDSRVLASMLGQSSGAKTVAFEMPRAASDSHVLSSIMGKASGGVTTGSGVGDGFAKAAPASVPAAVTNSDRDVLASIFAK